MTRRGGWNEVKGGGGCEKKDTGTDRLANEQVSLGLADRGQQSDHMTDGHDISTDGNEQKCSPFTDPLQIVFRLVPFISGLISLISLTNSTAANDL